MMTSRSLPFLCAALLLCLAPIARAAAVSADPAQKPVPAAAPQTGNQTGSVFSLGTISIAPSPQCFAGPAINAGAANKPQPSRRHHPARRSRRVAEPVPLRTYARI